MEDDDLEKDYQDAGRGGDGNGHDGPNEGDSHGGNSGNGQLKLDIIYNGLQKQFEARPSDLVKSLLDKAIEKFGPISNPHTFALYNKAGAELKDDQTLKQAGVEKRDDLLLRPSQVKGG